jgi:hypothetical protein
VLDGLCANLAFKSVGVSSFFPGIEADIYNSYKVNVWDAWKCKTWEFFSAKNTHMGWLKFVPCFRFSCLMTDCLCWVSGSTWPTSSHSARCPFCMRAFVNSTNLKIHIRDVHSVDRGPYICNKCGKLVKNRGSLRVHTYRFHTPKM